MQMNKVFLLGYIGQEPKITDTNNGKVASLSLATTEKGYTTKSGAAIPDRTEWHNIVMWGRLADLAEKYIHKGSPIMVEGKLRTRKYQAQDKTDRYITEIVAEEVQLLPNQKKEEEQDSYFC